MLNPVGCAGLQLILKIRQALRAKTSRAVRVEGVSVNVEAFVAWDNAVKAVVAKAHSAINDSCLKAGLRREFPANAFSLMIGSGAKGSPVNHTMIVGGLGQQVRVVLVLLHESSLVALTLFARFCRQVFGSVVVSSKY